MSLHKLAGGWHGVENFGMNITPTSKVLIQGCLEPLANIHIPLMQTYGTNLVAGVSPGSGGQTIHGMPVFDLVEQARLAVGDIDVSILFNHPYRLLDAALEAIAAGIRHIIIVTEGMPPLDVVQLLHKADMTETIVLGPNCPGLIMPRQLLLGTYPTTVYQPGSIGIISRCGTLTHEVAWQLTQAGFGQSIAVGIGSGPIVGSSFAQWLQILDEDDSTDAIVLVGEINGEGEDIAAQYAEDMIDKPVIAYLAGHRLPQATTLAHGNNVLTSYLAASRYPILGNATVSPVTRKLAAFKQAGIPVAQDPSEIPQLIRAGLGTIV